MIYNQRAVRVRICEKGKYKYLRGLAGKTAQKQRATKYTTNYVPIFSFLSEAWVLRKAVTVA